MLIRLLKVIVSITLISVLFWGIDWQDIVGRLRSLNPLLAIVAFVLLSIQFPLSAWKWRKSIRLHGADERLGRLLRLLCTAFFFNNFLPTAIGGDAYRAYKTFNVAVRPAHAISAVISERLLGILALLFVGYLCALYLLAFESVAHRELVAGGLVIGAAGFAVAFLMWLMRPRFAQQIIDRLQRVPKLEPFFCSLSIIRRNRKHFRGLVGLSLVFQLLAVFNISVLFAAFGIHGTIAESGFTAAASGITTVLPISINGVGPMEASFVVASLEVGMPYSESVLVALCLRAYILLASLVCGLLYMFEPKLQLNTLHTGGL
jgi:uncharacterized protein (TIRG00374 family)